MTPRVGGRVGWVLGDPAARVPPVEPAEPRDVKVCNLISGAPNPGGPKHNLMIIADSTNWRMSRRMSGSLDVCFRNTCGNGLVVSEEENLMLGHEGAPQV